MILSVSESISTVQYCNAAALMERIPSKQGGCGIFKTKKIPVDLSVANRKVYFFILFNGFHQLPLQFGLIGLFMLSCPIHIQAVLIGFH